MGLYPLDRSPYGAMDMAGNVWDWCLNKVDWPKIITPDTSGGSRVLRGGSWGAYTVGARASNRNGSNLGSRGDNWGFRVLSSVPIKDR